MEAEMTVDVKAEELQWDVSRTELASELLKNIQKIYKEARKLRDRDRKEWKKKNCWDVG